MDASRGTNRAPHIVNASECRERRENSSLICAFSKTDTLSLWSNTLLRFDTRHNDCDSTLTLRLLFTLQIFRYAFHGDCSPLPWREEIRIFSSRNTGGLAIAASSDSPVNSGKSMKFEKKRDQRVAGERAPARRGWYMVR